MSQTVGYKTKQEKNGHLQLYLQLGGRKARIAVS